MEPAPSKTVVKLPTNWQNLVKESRAEKREISVSDREVDEALTWLQESRATYRQVLREAKDGDAVEVDFEISTERKPIPGGKAEGHRLILGKGGYIPGFEDAIRGMSQGEEKEISLSCPENYWAKEIAGKVLSAKIKVKSIQERTLSELSDEFAKSISQFKTLPDLKKSIREGLTTEKEEKERDRFRLLILERIDRGATVSYPESLAEREIATMIGELRSSVTAMGLPWPEYLKQIKKDEKRLATDFRPQAARRVRYALLLEAIADREGIEPSREEVESEMNRFLLRFSSPKEVEKNIDPAALSQYTRGVLRNEKVFQFLEKISA